MECVSRFDHGQITAGEFGVNAGRHGELPVMSHAYWRKRFVSQITKFL
jgi:hypothetical protein